MKKRQLLKKFPQLSLLSFVAACSKNSSEGLASFAEGFSSRRGNNNGGDNNGGNNNEANGGGPPPLPFKAGSLSKDESGFTATGSGGEDSLMVEVDTTTQATLTFSDAAQTTPFGSDTITATTDIYKLTTTLNQYDLVVSAPNNNKNSSSNDYHKGSIFIFWNVEGIKGETIGAGSLTNRRLEVKGASVDDGIGINAPEFLQIAGKTGDQKYDMIIGSPVVGKISKTEGAIYVLWDVVDYSGGSKTIDLGTLNEADPMGQDATSGSLAIYGATADDSIGIFAPDFSHIGGATDGGYDMIIRSPAVDFSGDGTVNNTDEGAIYVLWDVESYYSTDNAKKNTTIDFAVLATITARGLGIFGAKANDGIGINAPEFLQIAGKTGEQKYDMIIGSDLVDKSSADEDEDKGAIYILWDVADYYSAATASPPYTIHTIVLDSSATDATSGSLAILGAKRADNIGTHAPEFLQIGGKDNNYDIVIRSQGVDKLGNLRNAGAIYVLWDVADYYSTQAIPNNTTIDLNAFDGQNLHATSGLLAIYGAYTTPQLAMYEGLGSDANNVLYNADGELTNIDGDKDNGGTKDIAFQDKDYTYVLFGDKIATTTGDGDNKRVTSKIVDLGAIDIALSNGGEGFFNYSFDPNGLGTATASTSTTDRVGYRFAGRKSLTEVKNELPDDSGSLSSESGVDFSAWDIA